MIARNWFTERVYIGIGSDFFGNSPAPDFNAIVDEVAISVANYNGEELYAKDKNGNLIVFRRRVKRCIMKETNKFIDGLGEALAEESARSQVSITQINRLIRAYKNKNGYVTCYAMVILHIAFSLILKSSPERIGQIQQLADCADALRKMTEAYYAENEDALARFLIRCYPPVKEELFNPQKHKNVEDFPPIPKRAPVEPTCNNIDAVE